MEKFCGTENGGIPAQFFFAGYLTLFTENIHENWKKLDIEFIHYKSSISEVVHKVERVQPYNSARVERDQQFNSVLVERANLIFIYENKLLILESNALSPPTSSDALELMEDLVNKVTCMIDVVDRFDMSQFHKSIQSSCINVMSILWNEFIIQSIRKQFSPRRCDAGEVKYWSNSDYNRSLKMEYHLALASTKRIRQDISRNDHLVKFIIDSGCSNHMTNAEACYMFKSEPVDSFIGTAGGPPLRCTKKGSIGPLTNVLHVPSAKFSLLSISNICDDGITAIFTRDEVLFTNNDEVSHVIAGLPVRQRGTRDGNLYTLMIDVSDRNREFMPTVDHYSLVTHAEATNRYTVWHNRFNHCGHEQLRVIRDSGRYPEVTWDDDEYISHKATICHGCATGKMVMSGTRKRTRELIPENHPSNRAGGLILVDLFFSNITSYSSKEIGLILVDAYSKCIWVKFGRSKDETVTLFNEWLEYMKGLKFNIGSIALVRSDNGGEFISNSFVQVLNTNGISPERAPPYAHVNRAERAIRHVKETARSFVNTNRINLSRLAAWKTNGRTSNPYIFWTDAMSHASHVFNVMPEKKFSKEGISRYERFFSKTPDLTRCKVFGCTAYVHIPRETRKSFEDTSCIGVYMGFSPLSPQTWRVMNIQTGRIVESRTVVFNENVDTQNIPTHVRGGERSGYEAGESHEYWQESAEFDSGFTEVIPENWELTEDSTESYVATVYEGPSIDDHWSDVTIDGMCLLAVESMVDAVPIPKSVGEAKNSPEWSKAYDKEIQSFISNDILTFVHRTTNMKVLGWRWVFRVKENTVTGDITYKARGTIRGDHQVEGVDYDETFAPVARSKTLRLLLSIVCELNLECDNMDVDTAFLYGEKQDDEPDVYVQIPAGYPVPAEFKNSGKGAVGKLKRHVYGLKQAPRTWFRTLSEHLVSIGFTACVHEPCLFLRRQEDNITYIFVYVDDLVIAANSRIEMSRVKLELSNKWSMKDLGPLESILGIRIIRDRQVRTLTLSQERFIDTILKKFKFEDVRAAKTPLAPGSRLTKDNSPKTPAEIALASKHPYRQVIGSLMYLMVCTRPDIAFAISQLSRYSSNHGTEHWNALVHVIRYVKGTKGLGITFKGGSLFYPCLFSDASFASDIDSKKSVSAYISYVGGGPVSWKSKLQSTTALSSCESEYIALCAAAQEAVHLKGLFLELVSGVTDTPVVIHEDNMSTIQVSKNPVLHERQKHVEVKYHFVRECVARRRIHVCYLRTHLMLADLLTKAVTVNTWTELISPLVGPVDIDKHVSRE